MRIRIGVFAFLAGLILAQPVFADGMKVDVVTDGIILAGGVAAAGLTELLLPGLPSPWGSLGTPDITTVNALDRAVMFRYSHGLDLASTILEYSSVAAPAVFALVLDPGDFITMAIVYGQAVSYAFAVKNLLNYLVPRYRPYMYEGGAPGVGSDENDLSFPSGHTTVAFAAATAGVTIYAMSYPDSPYLVPFAIASYSMAVLTGSFRVAAGMHFVTDVVAGAALGSAIGYLVPFLHRKLSSTNGTEGLGMETTGSGLMVRFRY
jgi:membrane-associated phospholipid phosphatase